MWDCMTASYTANLVFIDGVLDRYKHIDILKNKLKDNSHKLELLEDSYFFRRDRKNGLYEYTIHSLYVKYSMLMEFHRS